MYAKMPCFTADKYVSGGGPKAAEKARIILKLMQFIGALSGGKTVTQVALNYLMCKGRSHCCCRDHGFELSHVQRQVSVLQHRLSLIGAWQCWYAWLTHHCDLFRVDWSTE